MLPINPGCIEVIEGQGTRMVSWTISCTISSALVARVFGPVAHMARVIIYPQQERSALKLLSWMMLFVRSSVGPVHNCRGHLIYQRGKGDMKGLMYIL